MTYVHCRIYQTVEIMLYNIIIIIIKLHILKYRLEYTCYFICTDNTQKIVIIAVVTLTAIIIIYTIRREDEYLYTHPIPAEDDGKNGLLVLPKRH